jgi:hypothetical protein
MFPKKTILIVVFIVALTILSSCALTREQGISFSGESKHWKAVLTVDYGKNMKNMNETFILKYKNQGDSINVGNVDITYTCTCNNAKTSARRILPKDKTIVLEGGVGGAYSPYKEEDIIKVNVKWKNNIEHFDLTSDF